MNIFPHTKIKAQIKRNEEIGRISGKAVELISACSALFVRDLIDGDGDGDGKSSGATASSTSSRKRKSSSGTENGGKDANENSNSASSAIIDLEYIKRQTKRSEYTDFLDGVLDELTDKHVETMAKQRMWNATHKRNKQQKKAAQEQATDEKQTDSMLQNLPIDSKEEAGSTGDNDALKEAIQNAQSAASNGGTEEIIEDDDDYD